MDADEIATFAINEQQKEVGNILSGSSLYLDMTFLQRENFVRYLASIILH